VEPTTLEVWIVSRLPHELALAAKVEAIADKLVSGVYLDPDYDSAKTAASQSSINNIPTLSEIEGSIILAKESTSQEIKNILEITGTIPGANEVIIQIIDPTSELPIPNVSVIIRDIGDNYNTRMLVTDSTGIAITYLDNGSYPIRLMKEMTTFQSNLNIVVSNETEVTLNGTVGYKPIAVIPGLQTIYGRVLKGDSTPDQGQIVSIVIKTPKLLMNN